MQGAAAPCYNIIIIGGILILYIYKTRLASNEIFPPSNKKHREEGRAKDLSAPLYGSEYEYYFLIHHTLDMEAACFSKTLIPVFQTTWLNIPEDCLGFGFHSAFIMCVVL